MPKANMNPHFRGASQPTAPRKSALTEYIERESTSAPIKAFVEAMRTWQKTMPSNDAFLGKVDYQSLENLVQFTQCFGRALPALCTECEGLSRRHHATYQELADLIGEGVATHTVGILRMNKHEVDMSRYGQALSVITDLLCCPTPRIKEVQLPPLHVDEHSYLEGVLSDKLAEATELVFQYMRNDKVPTARTENQAVDFLVERTTHILAPETRFTDGARKGMTSGFIRAHAIMTPPEHTAILRSRYATHSPEAAPLITKLLRDIELPALRRERSAHHSPREERFAQP